MNYTIKMKDRHLSSNTYVGVCKSLDTTFNHKFLRIVMTTGGVLFLPLKDIDYVFYGHQDDPAIS